MRIRNRVLPSLAGLAAIVVLAAPVAEAQCATPQTFASTGHSMLGMVQVEIDGGLTGTEIGRFWNTGNSTLANNFADTCPATDWLYQRTSGDRGVRGGISVENCIASSCPGPTDEMIWLIEDYGPSGPPGVSDSGHFIGFRMDATPPTARYWDLARAAGYIPATLSFMPFPWVDQLNRAYVPPFHVRVTFNLVDAGLNFWGANAGGTIPDSTSIVSYDICAFHGANDPGRLRADYWDCFASIPYADGPISEYVLDFECPDDGYDTYAAVGITFDGGTGPDVPSELVGAAVELECDPNLADPDSVPHLQGRPYVLPKPRRGDR